MSSISVDSSRYHHHFQHRKKNHHFHQIGHTHPGFLGQFTNLDLHDIIINARNAAHDIRSQIAPDDHESIHNAFAAASTSTSWSDMVNKWFGQICNPSSSAPSTPPPATPPAPTTTPATTTPPAPDTSQAASTDFTIPAPPDNLGGFAGVQYLGLNPRLVYNKYGDIPYQASGAMAKAMATKKKTSTKSTTKPATTTTPPPPPADTGTTTPVADTTPAPTTPAPTTPAPTDPSTSKIPFVCDNVGNFQAALIVVALILIISLAGHG